MSVLVQNLISNSASRIFFHTRTSSFGTLGTHLAQQQVDDMEDHVERELGCEEGEEPLGGVHVRLQTHVEEVSVQIWDVFLMGENKHTSQRREKKIWKIKPEKKKWTETHLHESLKLEKLAMQIFKVLLEKVPEPVIEHDLDEHAEGLLLRHLGKISPLLLKLLWISTVLQHMKLIWFL